MGLEKRAGHNVVTFFSGGLLGFHFISGCLFLYVLDLSSLLPICFFSENLLPAYWNLLGKG